MKQRHHKTVSFRGYRAKDGEGHAIDKAIDEILKTIERGHGPCRLVDFKIYPVETQALPPRHETFLTVIADEVET